MKENLDRKYGLETFFPVFPPKKRNSATGLPLFPRYVFVRFELERDLHKIQYTPGVSKVVVFGATHIPVSDEVILCLKSRCDQMGHILPPELMTGQKVRVKQGIFEGCEGIIREKRGNRRVQLLLELAYGHPIKVEVDKSEVEPYPTRPL